MMRHPILAVDSCQVEDGLNERRLFGCRAGACDVLMQRYYLLLRARTMLV
jgi:hypothetical protein